jgi:hypothetical protein
VRAVIPRKAVGALARAVDAHPMRRMAVEGTRASTVQATCSGFEACVAVARAVDAFAVRSAHAARRAVSRRTAREQITLLAAPPKLAHARTRVAFAVRAAL